MCASVGVAVGRADLLPEELDRDVAALHDRRDDIYAPGMLGKEGAVGWTRPLLQCSRRPAPTGYGRGTGTCWLDGRHAPGPGVWATPVRQKMQVEVDSFGLLRIFALTEVALL